MRPGTLSRVIGHHLGLPDLMIFADSDWSSSVPGYRQRIRARLSLVTSAGAEALDLSRQPAAPGRSVSISHHRGRGGFAIAGEAKPIGFDMELRGRARAELVARVCEGAGELAAAPDPSALWCAKEAAFKSLNGHGQPAGVRDIDIGEWRAIGPHADVYSCRATRVASHAAVDCRGIVVLGEDECWSVFALGRLACAGS